MHHSLGFRFDNSYTSLPEKFFVNTNPVPVSHPTVCLFNNELAKEIGLNIDTVKDADIISKIFSGNVIPDGAIPISQAYAGHQFGHFTMLGDGRAILLGEHITGKHKRIDIQLKGAGQTPFSRRGDGRATLRSMLREYLISEAMHALNIPSSRSLAVITTGEKVYREEIHDGAVLTRLASSHIRVGTFEYVRNFLSVEELKVFTKYVVDRHYPALISSENMAIDLLEAVMHKQIDLIVEWMRVGFIHGVMNTDNMSVCGETFDYGPCAFMNTYHPDTVFSSIDTGGRYAYDNQPSIAHWNLACLASALLPLIDETESEAIKKAQEVLNSFQTVYEEKWWQMMGKKIGFQQVDNNEKNLISRLLQWMKENKADFTNTFLFIQGDLKFESDIYTKDLFVNWLSDRKKLLALQNISIDDALTTMRSVNPQIIPRNHQVEKALDLACYQNDFSFFHLLLKAVQSPYSNNSVRLDFQFPSENGDGGYRTFCGT